MAVSTACSGNRDRRRRTPDPALLDLTADHFDGSRFVRLEKIQERVR
jgi:hypothetical protein